MAAVLVVIAHPGPESFTHAWAAASVEGARAAGHAVTGIDLYAEGFDPVAPEGGPDIAYHVAALKAADHLIVHFPLWWYGPPAMLKGWIDRVLVFGDTYDIDTPFQRGPLRGKRALFCVSAGVRAEQCGPSGRAGEARLQLWPLAHGLRFAGIDVLEPYITPGIDADQSTAQRILMDAQIAQVLGDQAGRMAMLHRLPVWVTNPDSDFDASGQLKPDAPVYSPFIRHDDGQF